MGNEKPPFLGTWKNVYILVVGALVLQIVIYYLFTKYFE